VLTKSFFGKVKMEAIHEWRLIGAIILLTFIIKPAWAELEPSCAENSPECRGEIGCSLVENKPLPESLTRPLFWHIDRFDSEESARAAVRHVTELALPSLPPAPKYSMLVMSAYIPTGLTSRVHYHSGVEAFYTVDGEQCLETPTGAHKILKGGSLAVPAGVTMRLAATGSMPRRALAVMVYDASQPPPTRVETGGPQLVSCR